MKKPLDDMSDEAVCLILSGFFETYEIRRWEKFDMLKLVAMVRTVVYNTNNSWLKKYIVRRNASRKEKS
jgi:hypothetical protein